MNKYNVYEWLDGKWSSLITEYDGTIAEAHKLYRDLQLKFVKLEMYDVYYFVKGKWKHLELLSAEEPADAIDLTRRLYGFNDNVKMKAEKL